MTTIDTVEQLEALYGQTNAATPELYGWAGWIHWETSGAHFYAWDVPRLFFSVDIYACKPFSVQAVLDLTSKHFGTDELEFKEF